MEEMFLAKGDEQIPVEIGERGVAPGLRGVSAGEEGRWGEPVLPVAVTEASRTY
jgi:hypothetical protein